MDDTAIQLLQGERPSSPNVWPLVVMMLLMGMLLLACLIVVVERKFWRGDFDPLSPEMFRPSRAEQARGFPVIVREERHPTRPPSRVLTLPRD
jgi:hypothetical protein